MSGGGEIPMRLCLLMLLLAKPNEGFVGIERERKICRTVDLSSEITTLGYGCGHGTLFDG